MGDFNDLHIVLLVLQLALSLLRGLPSIGGSRQSHVLAQRVARLEKEVETLRSRRLQ